MNILGSSSDNGAVEDFLWAVMLLPEFQLIISMAFKVPNEKYRIVNSHCELWSKFTFNLETGNRHKGSTLLRDCFCGMRPKVPKNNLCVLVPSWRFKFYFESYAYE